MTNDDMNIVKYLIIIELVVLLLAHNIAGQSGVIWSAVISAVMICGSILFILSFGSHMPADKLINKQFLIVLLVCGYMAAGVILLFSEDKLFNYLSYIWLTSVIIFEIRLFIVSYQNDPIAQLEREQYVYTQKLAAEECLKSKLVTLDDKYEAALADEKLVNGYLKLSKSLAKKNKANEKLAESIADYTANLMHTYCSADKYAVATKLLIQYLNKILPYVGLSKNSGAIAALGIFLDIKADGDGNLFDLVNGTIVSKIDIEKETNPTLLFNLACYYSRQKDLDKLLYFTKLTLMVGKHVDSFNNDKDFNYYRKNPDFIRALHTNTNNLNKPKLD